MPYFILTSSEDGTHIEQVSEKELLERITPDDEGYTHYGDTPKFLKSIPHDDKGCWDEPENAMLIIRGEIVQPKMVKVATKYEL